MTGEDEDGPDPVVRRACFASCGRIVSTDEYEREIVGTKFIGIVPSNTSDEYIDSEVEDSRKLRAALASSPIARRT